MYFAKVAKTYRSIRFMCSVHMSVDGINDGVLLTCEFNRSAAEPTNGCSVSQQAQKGR